MIYNSSYQMLPEIFYSFADPDFLQNPEMVCLNLSLAEDLGLLGSKYLDLEFLTGKTLPAPLRSISQAYAGHQFGYYNILGDGRAHILGEIKDPQDKIWDIQLKGSGRTPYSRGGDGKATLGPMLREYIISEAMNALGVPTTRSLAVIKTGELVERETLLPGAVLVRIAASHIRVGTFEYAQYRGGATAVKSLADYTIKKHFPKMERDYESFLEAVIDRQASLMAQWMGFGFIHGVMNTDNMSLSGETIDYGPCAFMDEFDFNTVFSSIDREGRYAYGRQPAMAHWNLSKFAESLIPLLDKSQDVAIQKAQKKIDAFQEKFENYYFIILRKKIGLNLEKTEDRKLLEDLLKIFSEKKYDYTATFYNLRKCLLDPFSFNDSILDAWVARWRERLALEEQTVESAAQLMGQVNPVIIPRNHWVESALNQAVFQKDFSLFNQLLEALKRPFEETPASMKFQALPRGTSKHYKTFCGT